MKISVVMQSFLGDYPNSRSMSKEKFLRAVNSFLAQTHDDKELIIVSDGCEITKKMYELYYSDKEEIKFCYLHRDLQKEKSMYSKENRKMIYRGLPRQIGRTIATGDVITYFDTDDIILSARLADLDKLWSNATEEHIWASNSLRFLNEKALVSESFKESKVRLLENYKLPILNLKTGQTENFFINLIVPNNMISTATVSISHRKNVKAKWENIETDLDENDKVIGKSEDNLFAQQLMSEGKCLREESATYIVCHYKNLWDV